MFRKVSCLIALCLCVALHGCRPKAELFADLKLTHEVLSQPPRVGRVTVLLVLTEASGAPVNKAQISLEGQMSHAGMTPVSGSASEVGPGRYIGSIDLSMAGDWVLIVKIVLPGKGTLQRQIEIKGVLPAQ